VKRHIKRKVLDYQHKITTWLAREYDAVFVEDLNVKGMLEQSHNARTSRMRRGDSSSPFSNTRPTCTVVTSRRLNPKGRRKSVRRAVWRR
jgi:transposase